MKIQSSNYIPVNKFSRDDLIKEQIQCNKEIIQATKEEIQARKKIISNNNKLIDTLEKGLAELAPFKAYCIEQLRLNANIAYNSANTINTEIKELNIWCLNRFNMRICIFAINQKLFSEYLSCPKLS